MDREEIEREWKAIISEMKSDSAKEGDFSQVYGVFLKLVSGGFTEHQALRIITYGLFHMPPDITKGK